jgi:arginine-tRNA-protein transferase
MQSLFRYVAPPSPCGYLPERAWSLEYELVENLTPAEYQARMQAGWRRFGSTLFRPRCPACQACRSLRVDVRRFRPSRSQRRAWQINQADIRVEIGRPSVSTAKLRLYDRYHAFQTSNKGWPLHPAKDAASYAGSFVENPFATQEWRHLLDGQLVAVGYVDVLPAGMSAIYFYYEPELRHRSLGTWNVLCLLEEANRRAVPYVYLGYYVEGCTSLEYKARFRPNQILTSHGQWADFRQ